MCRNVHEHPPMAVLERIKTFKSTCYDRSDMNDAPLGRWDSGFRQKNKRTTRPQHNDRQADPRADNKLQLCGYQHTNIQPEPGSAHVKTENRKANSRSGNPRNKPMYETHLRLDATACLPTRRFANDTQNFGETDREYSSS